MREAGAAAGAVPRPARERRHRRKRTDRPPAGRPRPTGIMPHTRMRPLRPTAMHSPPITPQFSEVLSRRWSGRRIRLRPPASRPPPRPRPAMQEHGARRRQTGTEYPAVHFSGFADINVSAQDKSEGSARVQRRAVCAARRRRAVAARELLRRAVAHAARRRRHRHAAGDGIQPRSRAPADPVRSQRPVEGVVRPLSHADQLLEHRVPSRLLAADHDQPARDGAVRLAVPAGPLRRRAGRGRGAGRAAPTSTIRSGSATAAAT